MNRAPRKTKRERKGPFVKPRAPAVPLTVIYQEIGTPEPEFDCNRGGDGFAEVG